MNLSAYLSPNVTEYSLGMSAQLSDCSSVLCSSSAGREDLPSPTMPTYQTH